MAFDYRREFFRYRHYYLSLEPLVRTPKARAYTMLILSLLAISFFGYFAIRPTVKTIVELNRKLADQRMVDQKLGEKIKALALAQNSFEEVQKDLPFILTALPKDPQLYPFLAKIERVASESGVSLADLRFSQVGLLPPTDSSPPSFSLKVEGSYSNLFSFLKVLEKMDRLVILDSAVITSEEKKTALSLDLKGKIHFLTQEFRKNE